MAPRGQKRSAAESKKTSAVKKTRTDANEEDALMITIVETIQRAEKLPATCRSMLITGVRGSLSTPSDERHEVQTAIVTMVDEVMSAQDAHLQGLLASAEKTVGNSEAEKLELAVKQSAADAALADEVKLLDGKTLTHNAAILKVSETQALLAEKKALQEAGDKSMAEMQNDKAAIQSASDNDLKAIQEGQTDCQNLLVLLQKLSFDESLIKALPATCGRGVPDRGAFDGMVVNQLETSLAQKLTDLTKSVEDEATAAKARSDAVDEAQAQVQIAVDLQGKASEEQANAEKLRMDASTALDAAKAALKAHETVERDALSSREEQLAALEAFRQTIRIPFEVLRDARVSSAFGEVNSDAKMVVEDSKAAPVEVGGA